MSLDHTVLTPVASCPTKRRLSSPDDATEVKRNRDQSPVVPTDTPRESAAFLTKEIFIEISNNLSIKFKEQMESMVHDLVTSLVPEIINNINKTLSDKVSFVESENKALRERVSTQEAQMDQANQYSRRNSLRVSGIPEESGEGTDTLILTLANSFGADLAIDEIDRSHRVGKPRPSSDLAARPRDILIKISTYRARQKLFTKRPNLKSSGRR